MANTIDTIRLLMVEEMVASGITQAQVCRKAGITTKHLNQFLNGHCGMSLDLIDKVFKAMNRDLMLATRANLGYRVSNQADKDLENEPIHDDSEVAPGT
jgi:transcriptional regulator with XRE-family HTH domain